MTVRSVIETDSSSPSIREGGHPAGSQPQLGDPQPRTLNVGNETGRQTCRRLCSGRRGRTATRLCRGSTSRARLQRRQDAPDLLAFTILVEAIFDRRGAPNPTRRRPGPAAAAATRQAAECGIANRCGPFSADRSQTPAGGFDQCIATRCRPRHERHGQNRNTGPAAMQITSLISPPSLTTKTPKRGAPALVPASLEAPARRSPAGSAVPPKAGSPWRFSACGNRFREPRHDLALARKP